MGYTTDFIGHVEIWPPLNHAETQYLTAYSQSRRCARPDGAYDIPRNPAAEHGEVTIEFDDRNTVGRGQPSFWCGWTPCWDGCCLSYDGIEKFYEATAWMRYLIDHFLAPGAMASTSDSGWFNDFTFDHVLNGTIAACRRDTRRLYLIRVDDNRVRERTIVPPEPEYLDFDLLPYEAAVDETSAARRRRRGERPGSRR